MAPPQLSSGFNSDAHQEPTWSPYDNNGGTVVAIAGKDYCVVASDTRLATGFSILTRHHTKLLQLSDRAIIATSGFQADMRELFKRLKARDVMYRYDHGRAMSVDAAAHLLHQTLYHRRFFPLYTFNLCLGLDEAGEGWVYTYDAIGSLERVRFSCQGTGSALIQPLLDNQLQAASPLLLPAKGEDQQLGLEGAVALLKQAFTSAGERDIYTGDSVEIVILTKEGVRRDSIELKKD